MKDVIVFESFASVKFVKCYPIGYSIFTSEDLELSLIRWVQEIFDYEKIPCWWGTNQSW